MSFNYALGDSLFEEWGQALEDQLSKYLRAYPYHAGELLEAAIYAVGSTGRRWRPSLFLTIYEKLSSGDTTNEAYAVACSVEYLHTASIILDDLPAMDDGTLRRGRKPCHLEFSPARAILTSFFLCDVAQHLVHEFGSLKSTSASADLEDLFRATKNEMMRGQILDLEGKDESLVHLVEKYRLKSGVLYALAACAPAHMLGLTDVAEKLQNFGNYLGIAYQISDDICDQVCTAEDLGKDVRQDKDKKTIARLYGIEKATELATSYKKKSVAELKDMPILAGLSKLVEEICP